MRPSKSLLEIVRNFGFAIWLLRLPHMAKLLQIFKKCLFLPRGSVIFRRNLHWSIHFLREFLLGKQPCESDIAKY
jgi:hypothetical protein